MTAVTYRVKYYDRKLSHKGRGTQSRRFATYEQAAEFASGQILYARPARVESVTMVPCAHGPCWRCEPDGTLPVYRLVTGPDDPGIPSPMK